MEDHPPPSSASAKPPRVIVVDDHEWILEIAVEIVRQTLSQAVIVTAKDGLEALGKFQSGGADFVVTNHHMPHMDGATLIHELRALAPDLPIVMISVNPDAKYDAMAAGADWFLTKEQLMEKMPPLLLTHLLGYPSWNV